MPIESLCAFSLLLFEVRDKPEDFVDEKDHGGNGELLYRDEANLMEDVFPLPHEKLDSAFHRRGKAAP